MNRLIGWTFILLSPLMLGVPAIAAVTLELFHLDPSTPIIIYLVSWTILFVVWFEDSKYQRAL
jgi:hypothetical protein